MLGGVRRENHSTAARQFPVDDHLHVAPKYGAGPQLPGLFVIENDRGANWLVHLNTPSGCHSERRSPVLTNQLYSINFERSKLDSLFRASGRENYRNLMPWSVGKTLAFREHGECHTVIRVSRFEYFNFKDNVIGHTEMLNSASARLIKNSGRTLFVVFKRDD